MCLCTLSSTTPALLHPCQSRPKHVSQAVTLMSTWYSNIQKASYVHTEVIPADLMQATHITSEILRTPSSVIVSVLSCGTGSGCSAPVNTGYRCGKNCHRLFLPHVLVTAKLLKSLPQLTEGAVNICCACWTHPDSGQLPFIATPHPSISEDSTNTLCPTPYPELASSSAWSATNFMLMCPSAYVSTCAEQQRPSVMVQTMRTSTPLRTDATQQTSLVGHDKHCNNKD